MNAATAPTAPGLLRYPMRGWPAGTLVRWETADEGGLDDYLAVWVVLPDGQTAICHGDDLVVPRHS